MEILRVNKQTDAIFTGFKMFFFSKDFGLIAIANRYDTESNEWDKKTIHHWKIERSEQIGKDMIEKTIKKYYSRYSSYFKVSHEFKYINESIKPQHTLPYSVDIIYK